MPDNMIERIAKAIATQMEAEDPGSDYRDGEFLGVARAVLNAMIKPTGDMIGDVHDTLLYHVKGNELATAELVWGRMIETALEDGR